jgi:hypothetical protein
MQLLVKGSEKKTTKGKMGTKFYQEIQLVKDNLKCNWNKIWQ